jgi:Caudovirus prohead serine protease
MADSIARVEIGLSPGMEELFKAGRRNARADEERLRELRKLVRQAEALINELGVEDEANLKALPLDQLTGAVESAVERLNRGQPYEDYSWENRYRVAAIYPDVVIIRKGLCHCKAPYTIEETKVEISSKDQWVEVEITWAEKKSEVEDGVSATTLIGNEGSKAAEVADEESPQSPAVFEAIKAAPNGRLRHYAVSWGSPAEADLYNEHFTKKTEEMDVIFKAIGKLPLLYHHAMDGVLKTSVVGVVDQMGVDEVGLWVESQLDMANRYSAAINQMVAAKKLGTSTGTLPMGRRVNKATGEITRWPIVEVSLTPTPAEPNLVMKHPVAAVKAAYIELGLPEPVLVEPKDTGAEEARQREIALERERLALLTLEV